MKRSVRRALILTALATAAVALTVYRNTAPVAAGSIISPMPGAEITRMDPALDALVAPDAVIEKVMGGLNFTEGPMWHEGRLWFSDSGGDAVYAVNEAGESETIIDKATGLAQPTPVAGFRPNAMVTDKDGTVIMAEQDARRIVRIVKKNGKYALTPFLETYEGKRLNSPNDLVFAKDGALWFTDPPYGLKLGDKDPAKELPFNAVYRYASGKLTPVIQDLTLPNGIGFSPDYKTLYVANSGPHMGVRRYDVKPDGSLAEGTWLIEYPAGSRGGVPDGLKVDSRGNLWSSGPGGIRIITPEGKVLGQIKLPETAANLAWSGDGKTLYITATKSVYRVKVLVSGFMPLYKR